MSAIMPNQLKHKEIIKCIPKGKYIGNRNCHCNCLSYAIKHNNVKFIHGVAQVFHNDEVCAHFILELNDGPYIDPTYGNLTSIQYKYCIPIEKYEISTFNPDRELQNLKDYIYSMQPFHYRLLHANNY